MGIFIHLAISKSVTKKEWTKVYDETLQLVAAFPLAEKLQVKCKGIDTVCLVPTAEHEVRYGWNNEKTKIGWNAIGDYETMHIAENYYLPKDLVEDNPVEPDAGDALLGVLPAYLMHYDWNDSRFSHIYDIWEAKSQGEPYHMYILAIAYLAKEAGQTAIRVPEGGMNTDELRTACEQDASEVFNQMMDRKRETLKKEFEKYDINEYRYLLYYKKGDTMHPKIMASLSLSFNFYKSILDEEEYAQLMKDSAESRCRWLIKNNRSILLRDIDWEQIFTDIYEHKESFGRYYPMMCVLIEHDELLYMVKAIVLNRELYEYCQELTNQIV